MPKGACSGLFPSAAGLPVRHPATIAASETHIIVIFISYSFT
jgi:hypothetical protein